MSILRQLEKYRADKVHRFHMPGHKGRGITPGLGWELDVTEIDGLDNLHDAHGIIKSAQERAATLFASTKSFFLVNGSTCGILSAIAGCTEYGDKVGVARNCHKSVYHSLELRNLQPIYLMPQVGSDIPFYGALAPKTVTRALDENKDIKALIITSPTYEGVISDVKTIAEICHEKGVILIVDEAHGSHLGLYKGFPLGALECGADVVIHSLHKTLPSLTQTALLHCNSALVDSDKVARYLNIFETSSPSYLLMASIDQCVEFLADKGEELFCIYKNNLEEFYKNSYNLKNISVYQPDDLKDLDGFCFDFDPGKILINTGTMGLKGTHAAIILREKNNIEMEMAKETYVLAMTSLMNTGDDFTALYRGLEDIDRGVCNGDPIKPVPPPSEIPEIRFTIAQALTKPWEWVPLSRACGSISRDYYWEYPPGIPLFTPGEVIPQIWGAEDKMVRCLKNFKKL